VDVWLSGGETRVRVEMFVDGHTAARLNAGRDQLRDNLIIRIQGGQDVSVSLSVDCSITVRLWHGDAKGGATVLKVGGQFCERSEQKNFLTPHFLASGGTKYCLNS